ncbi:hypothetical protein BSKO_10746 [Bryopsis sp. KO-2023]|nr:hypothetical protein BSKO_10746 [Bryopsis sp. KO-2023]
MYSTGGSCRTGFGQLGFEIPPCVAVQSSMDHYGSVDLAPEVTLNVQRLWGDSELSDIDVKFVFPDEASKNFHLHKFLLRNSEFFRASLSVPWRGTEKTSIQVQVEDPLAPLSAIETVLQALYAHKIEINECNVLGLIAASSFLGLPRVYEECRRFIEREMDLVNVSRFCNFAASSEYPVSEPIVHRCVKYLNVRAFDDARELLPELPASALKRLFVSPGMWVPSEADKFELIIETFLTKLARCQEDFATPRQVATETGTSTTVVELCPTRQKGGDRVGWARNRESGDAGGVLDSANNSQINYVRTSFRGACETSNPDHPGDLVLWYDGEEVRFGVEMGSLTVYLREILCEGIQYMHTTDRDFIKLRKHLWVARNPCFMSVMEKHCYNQKVLLSNLQKMQIRHCGEDDEDLEGEEPEQLIDNEGWFYFGAELEDAMGFLESRKRQPSEETYRIHYGGSDWSVGFIREKDRGSTKLSIALRRWECTTDRAAKFGLFSDKRPSVGVEMKLFADDIVREGVAVIGTGNCYVFSGVVTREALGDYLVTYDDDFRVTVGLRLA